jgi:hypothetical protein
MAIIVLPTTSFTWEDMSRADYISGKIDVDQFEAEVWTILQGSLPDRLFGGMPPPRDPSKPEVR